MSNKDLSLYGISQEVLILDDLLMESEGEITEDFEAKQKEIFDLLQNKVDGCVGYVNKQKDLVKLAAEKVKEINLFKKSIENKLAKFDQYVNDCLDAIETDKISGSMHEIKKRKPAKVLHISNEDDVPGEYIVVKTTTSIDLVKLKADVKSGALEHDSIKLIDGKKSLIYGFNKGGK